MQFETYIFAMLFAGFLCVVFNWLFTPPLPTHLRNTGSEKKQ
jgi:hypothetical protein